MIPLTQEFKKIFLGKKIKQTILFLENSSLPEPAIQDIFKNFKIITQLAYSENKYVKREVTHIYTRLSTIIDEKFLTDYEQLKFIGCPTTSNDHIQTELSSHKGIKLITIKDRKKLLKQITSTAELTTWLIIELSRNPSRYAKNVLDGKWDRYAHGNESLNGKTLGIIGMGRVGTQVARVFSDLGMKIIFFDVKKIKFSKYKKVSTIFKLAEQSDYITIHVNGNATNKNLIESQFLSHLKAEGSYLINTSRGLVVNEEDIIKSIKNGKLKGYATDVLINEQTSDMKWLNDNPIWKEYRNEGKIIITPHIGGATKDSLIKVDNFILNALSRSTAK